MGVNGIYGLSGSGLDIESMVKVGMLSKQSEYEKMQQKFTQNEWKKSEYLDVYSTIQTFNASTLSQYKMSSSMDARSATSANDSVVTATANANAVPMTHYVEVESLASSAYLLGTSMERKNNSAADKNLLSSVLYKSIELVTDGDNKTIKIDGSTTTLALTNTALTFSLSDGVNGMLGTKDSDVVIASASPATATGTYVVKITDMAEPPQAVGATVTGLSPDLKVSDALASVAASSGMDLQGMVNYLESNTNIAYPAVAFTLGDGTNSVNISYSYKDVLALVQGEKTFSDFIDGLNEKIGDKVAVRADITAVGTDGKLSFINDNVGEDSKVVISMDFKKIDETSKATDTKATNTTFDRYAVGILAELVRGFIGGGINNEIRSENVKIKKTNGIISLEMSGNNAKGTIYKTDSSGNIDETQSETLVFKGNEGTVADTSTNFKGISATAKAKTGQGTDYPDGIEISNTGSQNIKVTYQDLLDGFTLYDLTSKINQQGTNIRATYDSVQDRFSFYNQKTGAANNITFGFGKGDAAQNAVNFFKVLGLKQSANGELKELTDEFKTGDKVVQAGTNSTAKIDGLSYTLDSNKVSVNGVSYNLQNVTSDKVAVTITQDTTSIVKNVESFVEDYNKLINKLYEWYDEKPNSNYKPLTESQKSGMKEDQIEKWEEKAKAGLLYHDQTLSKVISDIRSAVSQTVDGINSKYNNIFAIGISTTGLKGELKLDKDKLNAALAEDAQAVYNVFARLDSGEKQYAYEKDGKIIWVAEGGTVPDGYKEHMGTDGKQMTKTIERSSYNGIAQRLGDVFQASMKSVKSVSGSTADISEDSELNNLLRELQTKMSNFKRMMDAFETKLYKKYDAMESALALLGSQLNYVTSAFQ